MSLIAHRLLRLDFSLLLYMKPFCLLLSAGTIHNTPMSKHISIHLYFCVIEIYYQINPIL